MAEIIFLCSSMKLHRCHAAKALLVPLGMIEMDIFFDGGILHQQCATVIAGQMHAIAAGGESAAVFQRDGAFPLHTHPYLRQADALAIGASAPNGSRIRIDYAACLS